MNKRAGLFLLAAILGGCSLISVDNKTRYSDASGFFDAALLGQIKAGETSGEWMHQHFGDPLFVDQGFINPAAPTEPVSIETWRFVRHQQKNTSVFLLFRSRSRADESEYLHTVLANDLVVKAWRDTLETVDTRRVMANLGYTPVNPPVTAAPAAAAAPLSAELEPASEPQAPLPEPLQAADVTPVAAADAPPPAGTSVAPDKAP